MLLFNIQSTILILTYVRVGMSWHYICILIDLFNREIIEYNLGRNKDAPLVTQAFTSVRSNLNKIQIFHTDRCNVFKNEIIGDTLEAFNINRSLNDNVVTKITFTVVKIEFVYSENFNTLENYNAS